MKTNIQQFMRSAKPDVSGSVTLGPRRIYIFPTRYGFLFGVALALMLIGSLNYDSNLGLLFTFLFVSMGVVAILQTWKNLLELKISAANSAPCFAGQAAVFPITLSDSRGRDRPALRLRQRKMLTNTLFLPGGKTQKIYLRIDMPSRGEHPLGRLEVFSVFPYGFLRAWAYLEGDANVLVYPKPGHRSTLSSTPEYENADAGDRGMGADDFVGLRPYRVGDAPRHLDWKAFARERGLVTRQFGGDRAEKLWIDWSALPKMETEQKLSLLCRMVLDASQRDLQFGLRLPDLEYQPNDGDIHKHRCLAALARFQGGDE